VTGEGLLDRLVLQEGNVLADLASGRKLVLNPSGVAFFGIFRDHGDTDVAVRQVAARYGLDAGLARAEYRRFLELIDQGQRCEGSILPGRHHAVLEPTAACNGQCPHCYHGDRSSRWPREEFGTILDQVRAGGIRSVSITGGEVFSAHFVGSFFELARELEDRGVAIASVSTNATFLTEDIRDRVLAVIPRTTVFRVSLDALRGDLLDRIRPGYRHLADPYGPVRDLDEAGYPLVFTTNLSGQPAGDVLEIGDYLRRYRQVRAWNVRMAVPVHHGEGERARSAARRRQLLGTRPSPALGLRYYRAILEAHAASEYPFDVRMGNYLMTSLLRNPAALTAFGGGHPCREDQYLVTVKATGEVTQCPILTELAPELTMGPAGAGGLAEGFEDSLPLAGLDTATMGCRSCPLLAACGGGCRLYALAYDQGLEGCDLPARALLSWLVTDPDGLLRRHWPQYHARLVSFIADPASVARICEQDVTGRDAR
jgi:radical SAM protein with 4Fe4S-binding SPASM domain